MHGANRLASNSLLEGLVFARRIAEDVAGDLPPQGDPVVEGTPAWAVPAMIRGPLQRAMSQGAGVLRSKASLTNAGVELTSLGRERADAGTETWEATNLLTVASTLVAAATRRQETRGCHWREDFPEPDERWLGHILVGLDPDGVVTGTWQPLGEVR